MANKTRKILLDSFENNVVLLEWYYSGGITDTIYITDKRRKSTAHTTFVGQRKMARKRFAQLIDCWGD